MTQELKTSAENLIDKEYLYRENSEKIKNLLVQHLVSYLEKDRSLTSYDLEDILGNISPKVSEYMLECIDIDSIIIEAKEQIVDEKKLMENGIIYTAEHAAKLTNAFREEYDALKFSGLNKNKIRILKSIQKSILERQNDTTFYFHNVNGSQDYLEELSLVKWIESLGFTVQKLNHGNHRIIW